MSLRRAAPGPQLGGGRLRVDAGRAIAKLREYQLADRSAWVLEAIRAAVAAKATRIELRGDANDVWLSWHGEPWPDDVLPRLFDELVSPEAASESQHVRLLAAAVNSALGMAPAYVDVTAIHAGAARRVRYTPEILLEPESELGTSALRHVAVESVAPPDGARPGMLVHLRRRLTDWHVFGEPPELGLARAACRNISVPLQVGAVVLQRDTHRDVIRIPLGEGLDGFIAITEAERATTSATLEVAERGVVLADYALELLDGKQRGPVPVRVFVDAPRMPTNASRSQVRRDVHPIASAEKRAHKLAPELIAQLAAAVQQGSERARTSALTLVAALGGGPRWHVDVPALRGPLRAVAELPLVKNALGHPRALTAHWRAEVHTGRKPFAAELAPWLDNVLWAAPGDPTVQLLGGADVDTRGTRRLARWARKQLRAQLRFYSHAKREARVLTSVPPLIRAPLGCAVEKSAVSDEMFKDLGGEVCLYTAAGVGALVVLLQGRELERIEFDSPIAFDVVIDSPRVAPADRYRGVKRDAEYKRVERAMRAGLLRALEAHAAAGRRHLVGDEADAEARLVRKGFGVMSELGVPARGPLATAPIYGTPEGTWTSLAELAKHKAIGVAPPGQRVALPQGRLVVELDSTERTALAQLVPGRIVPYRRDRAADLHALTMNLVEQGGGALVIREPRLHVALTPTWRPELRLHHLGVELEQPAYRAKWLACTIAIDSDDLVPDLSWTVLVDDAGLRARDYADWELALVRAIARALAGEAVPELVRAGAVDLDGKLGTALCAALQKHEPDALLGEQLVAKLRAARIVRLLGEPEPVSMDDIAARFPTHIPYIGEDTVPVAGFTPMIAAAGTAKALCRLIGREAVHGAATLEQRRRQALRELRLAAHRELAKQPMIVPADGHVAVDAPGCRGLVGVASPPFAIRVFVEGRPFTILHPSDRDLPLTASVELGIDDIDDAFENVKPSAARDIAIAVRAAAPALLAEIARQKPHLLGNEGPVRTLLATVPITSEQIRETLVAAPAFATVQGGRVSLKEAAQPFISVAAWHGEWLGPEVDGPDPYDRPALYVPDDKHELLRIFSKLQSFAITHVTEGVSRLQARRRMARGLVPRPQVRSATPALKRSLDKLGAAAKQLGHGEIGLVEELASTALVHVEGSLRRSEALDVLPAIELAIEDHARADVLLVAQQLAVELVRDVVERVDLATLSPRLQRNLMRAGLAKRLPGVLLERLPRWRDFVAQHEKHGNVWVVHAPTALTPLDADRIVFVLEPEDSELAREHGWHVTEATRQLELDALARKNMARPTATSLALRWRDGVIAQELLAGDGQTSPRGVVAVLSPASSASRGVWPHRAMHPFDRVDDPCKWPTMSVIDDARLAPDRTWQAPVANDDWQAVAKELRAASERALAKVGDVPEHALVHLRINSHACAEVAALRKAPKSLIRGVLWLTGTPRETVAVQVIDVSGMRSFAPPEQLAIGGKLYVLAPDNLDIDLALRQLCNQTHGKLVRALVKDDLLDADLVAAHVAHALAVRTLRATDVRAIEFPCFSPKPLDARALSSLLRREDPVVVIKPETAPNPDPNVIELVDDASELSHTLIADLGARVRRARPPAKPRPAPEAPPAAAPPRRAPAKPPKPAKPEPPHPLAGLVAKLRGRLAELGIGGYDWEIVDEAEPMFAYDKAVLVAGDNVRLRALAAAVAAKSPLVDAGVDVVVADLVTVLNVALSQITDASEAHALGVLLTQASANRSRSRRSS